MEKLFLIGAAGYVALSFYTIRLKKNYVEVNSNRFLIDVMIWGAFPYIVFIIIRHLAVQEIFLKEFFHSSPDLVFPMEGLTLLIIASFIGIFLSTEEVDNFRCSLIEKFFTHTSRDPLTSGLVEYDWMRFTKSQETLIFTMKNNKIYTGILLFADYKSNMAHDQRAIRITPLKSGVREVNGNVKYTTFYFTPESIEINDSEINNKTEDELFEIFEQKYTEAISSIEDLVLFQREIVSYTVYSTELDDRFHGQKVTSDNLLEDQETSG